MNDKQIGMIELHGGTSNAVLKVSDGRLYRIAYANDTKKIPFINTEEGDVPHLFLSEGDANVFILQHGGEGDIAQLVKWLGEDVVDL